MLINGRRLVPGDPTSPRRRPQLHSRPDGRPRRSADRRRLGGLRRRRRGRRRQLHHGQGLRGRPRRRPIQLLSAQQRRRSGRPERRRLSTARGFGSRTGSVVDGVTYNVNVAVGLGFDEGRGHVTLYGGYRKIEASSGPTAITAPAPARRARRPRSRSHRTAIVDCGGSVTSANGTIFARRRAARRRFFQIGPNRTLIPGFTPLQFRAAQLSISVPTSATRLAPSRTTRSAPRCALSRSHVHGGPHVRPDRAVGRFRQHA